MGGKGILTGRASRKLWSLRAIISFARIIGSIAFVLMSMQGGLTRAVAQAGPTIASLTNGSAWLFAPSHYSQAVAYGPDHAIYFTEFAKQRLMKLSSKGLEVVLANQPGLYGVAVDTMNRVYVGLDLSDNKDSTGRYQGSVNQIKFNKEGKAESLVPIITGIRRPRNLVSYLGRLYLILEAERVIISVNPDERRDDKLPVVKEEFRLPIRDSANGLAIYKGRFYWAQYGEYPDRKHIVGGTIRSTSMTNPGEIVTLASGLGRTRGLGFDAKGNLYFTTESNALDQGNSGTLGMISPEGAITTLIDGLDYPQFITVFPDGAVLIPFCRENYIAMFQPRIPNKPVYSPYPKVSLYGVNMSSGDLSQGDENLTLTFTEFGRSYSFPVKLEKTSPLKGGWVTIPFESLNLSKQQLVPYRVELPYPTQPEVPAPGFFKKPQVTCTIGGRPCAVSILSQRSHGGWRWPMTGAAGHEKPPPGFSEAPDSFMINFFW